MNLQPFYELRERFHTVANAGVNLLSEDFRLKRAAAAIAPYAKASPVFAKISKMTNELLEPNCENASLKLLDTLALLDAVLTTQGSSGVQGELELFGNEEEDERFFHSYKNISSNVLRPLREAMTGTGSGRYNVILDTYNATPEVFEDFRVRGLLIGCLGDSYSEIASLAVQWLSQMGEAVIPALKQGFDPEGKKEMVHRVNIIANIAGAKENDFYLEQLPQSKKEVKEALIEALHFEPKNADLLVDLMKSERGRAKASARWSTSFMDTPEIRTYWEEQLEPKQSKGADVFPLQRNNSKNQQDKGAYVFPMVSKELSDSTQDWAADIVMRQFVENLEEFIHSGNNIITQESITAIFSYFEVLKGKFTDKFPDYLLRLGECGQIFDNWKKDKDIKVEQDGARFCEVLSFMLADTFACVSKRCSAQLPKMTTAVQELCDKYGDCYLSAKFVGAIFTRNSSEVYEEFHDDINTQGLILSAKKKKKYQAAQIMQMINRLSYDEAKDAYFYQYSRGQSWKGEYQGDLQYVLPYGFDLRWYKLIFGYEWKKDIKGYRLFGMRHYSSFEGVVRPLFRCDTPELKALYADFYYQKAKEESPYSEYIQLAMKCDPSRRDGILSEQLVKNKGNYANYVIRTYPNILNLSKEEVLAEIAAAKKKAEVGNYRFNDKKSFVEKMEKWIQMLNDGAAIIDLM